MSFNKVKTDTTTITKSGLDKPNQCITTNHETSNKESRTDQFMSLDNYVSIQSLGQNQMETQRDLDKNFDVKHMSSQGTILHLPQNSNVNIKKLLDLKT
jgi:hypothetical protein